MAERAVPTLYLLRHGETEWNRAGRLQGRFDSPLTERGRAQAAAVGTILLRELGHSPACALVSSPRGRALETARIVGDALGSPVSGTDERLAEITMGSWDGLTRAEVEARWLGALDGADAHEWMHLSPDGERLAQVRARVAAWLDGLRQPTIAVGYGMAGRLLRGHYAGIADAASLRLPEPQDAVFRLRGGTVEMLRASAAVP